LEAVRSRSFSPSPTAVDAAARLVAAYDAALDGGRGVVVGEDGKMIDEAVVRRARALLGRTGHEGGR
jgi:citrate lyase subunit beta/citryl-CoA lyase